MLNQEIYDAAVAKFKEWYGIDHTIAAYAPGRVEVLGNHTDYNEGFVLSAAIDMGHFFLVAPSDDNTCHIVAGDLMEGVTFPANDPSPADASMWANYVKGVFASIEPLGTRRGGFKGLFFGNIPLGSGLSSSAALEMSSGLALARLYDVELPSLELAKIGQLAEHEYAGVKCGLMDQLSSMNGKHGQLVLSDFRTLEVATRALGEDACLLMCNTKAKHALVDGAYNERREKCEEAAAFFATKLAQPVTALRDVSVADWEEQAPDMERLAAMRSAHVVGENDRVKQGSALLDDGDLAAFGELMFASHQSSIDNFENSCPELDFIVEQCRQIPGALGARLSGGGFGGSVVVLLHPRDVETVTQAVGAPYAAEFGHACEIKAMVPSDGAQLIDLA